MKIGGFEPCSLLDFPNKISCIIYTIGCNYRCGFCFNPDLITMEDFSASGRQKILEEEIFDYIKKNSEMLDACCITGGEPTQQPDLLDFCKKIKRLNKLVKLDTNGSNPKMLKEGLEGGIFDYVAMDLKGPLNRYGEITGYWDIVSIYESLELLKNSKVPFEIRVTLNPELTKQDIIDTISMVPGQAVYLQQFDPTHALSPEARKMVPIDRKIIEEIVEETKDIANVKLRGF